MRIVLSLNTPTTLSDAPGGKQPGGTLSLPPPMASHRLLAGFD